MGKKKRNFKQLASEYYPQMFRFALARLGSVEDAEDVVQEACVKALHSFGDLREPSRAQSWLMQILVNTIRDHVRKESKQPDIVRIDDVAETDITTFEKTSEGQQDPAISLVNKELNTNLSEALKELPDTFLTPLLLREIHGASYKEIADMLSIPTGTVMSRLARGRALLRKILTTPSDSPRSQLPEESTAINFVEGGDES